MKNQAVQRACCVKGRLCSEVLLRGFCLLKSSFSVVLSPSVCSWQNVGSLLIYNGLKHLDMLIIMRFSLLDLSTHPFTICSLSCCRCCSVTCSAHAVIPIFFSQFPSLRSLSSLVFPTLLKPLLLFVYLLVFMLSVPRVLF